MNTPIINTVTGPIACEDLGVTLIHEHLVLGPPGWEGDLSIAPFDRQTVVDSGVALLSELKKLGVNTYVDATTIDNGRMPEIYKEISAKSQVNVICATGYFSELKGASQYWHLRGMLGDVTEQVQELMCKEIQVGIRGTGIKAGVIKVATGQDCITDYERLMFRAAAGAHKETGVPVMTHTEGGTMGPQQAELLLSEGVDPSKVLIGHMCDNLDMAYQLDTIGKGVFIGWDRMGLQLLAGCPMDEDRYPIILDLIQGGHTDKLMLSQDAINTWLGRPFIIPQEVAPIIANWHPTHLFKNIIPMLINKGVTDEQIKTIIEDNPRRWFGGKP